LGHGGQYIGDSKNVANRSRCWLAEMRDLSAAVVEDLHKARWTNCQKAKKRKKKNWWKKKWIKNSKLLPLKENKYLIIQIYHQKIKKIGDETKQFIHDSHTCHMQYSIELVARAQVLLK
jgi:hypothetical protein